MSYTSWNTSKVGRQRQCRPDRLAQAERFRVLLAEMGLSQADAAKALHVSLRTLQNWLSGRHAVPYASYKLLRLLRYMELPGDAWQGWHFSRGQLVTPEGRTIDASESAWWSLLLRKAKSFPELYRRCNDAERVLAEVLAVPDRLLVVAAGDGFGQVAPAAARTEREDGGEAALIYLKNTTRPKTQTGVVRSSHAINPIANHSTS